MPQHIDNSGRAGPAPAPATGVGLVSRHCVTRFQPYHVRLHEDSVKKGQRRDLPSSPETRLEEIRAAYADAQEAIPFGPMAGHPFTERELFHLAAAVAVKFRNLPSRNATLKRATEAALSSYVANEHSHGAPLSDPRLAFAFCYLASHHGLGLVDKTTVESVMEFLERNAERVGEKRSREA